MKGREGGSEGRGIWEEGRICCRTDVGYASHMTHVPTGLLPPIREEVPIRRAVGSRGAVVLPPEPPIGGESVA